MKAIGNPYAHRYIPVLAHRPFKPNPGKEA